MQEGVYFGQGVQWNIYCDQTDSLQYILVNLIIILIDHIDLVWC